MLEIMKQLGLQKSHKKVNIYYLKWLSFSILFFFFFTTSGSSGNHYIPLTPKNVAEKKN